MLWQWRRLVLVLSLAWSQAQGGGLLCIPILASAGQEIVLPRPTSIEALERDYGQLVFVSRRQNRLFRHAFLENPSKGRLVLSIDFPLVSHMNRLFGKKTRTASVFSLYKKLFFDALRADEVLWGAIREVRDGPKIIYADYKNIGIVFHHDSPEIRQRLAKLQAQVADEFHRVTGEIPELREVSDGGQGMIRNRRGWMVWGVGANGLQATATSRLGRYHVPGRGLPEIRDFGDPKVQLELLRKFRDAETIRQIVVSGLDKFSTRASTTPMLTNVGTEQNPLLIPSERVWEILRSIQATDRPGYLSELQRRMRVEFRIEIPESLVWKLQEYYHLLDTFLPRVHESRENSISIEETPFGALYVDVRGQTRRNLVRMAQEMANVANEDQPGVTEANLLERAALALRNGQNQASRRFNKLRKTVKRTAHATGFTEQARVSGDEIVVPLADRSDADALSDFRSFVATVAENGLPVRPILVSGGTRQFSNEHVTNGENLEKGLRQKLKESRFPVEEWEDLTIGVRIVPSGPTAGVMTIILGERTGTDRVSRARPLIERWLQNPQAAAQFVPSGYTVSGVFSAARPTTAPPQ